MNHRPQMVSCRSGVGSTLAFLEPSTKHSSARSFRLFRTELWPNTGNRESFTRLFSKESMVLHTAKTTDKQEKIRGTDRGRGIRRSRHLCAFEHPQGSRNLDPISDTAIRLFRAAWGTFYRPPIFCASKRVTHAIESVMAVGDVKSFATASAGRTSERNTMTKIKYDFGSGRSDPETFPLRRCRQRQAKS